MVEPGIEAAGISGLRQQLHRLGRIVDRRRGGPVEREMARDEIAGNPGQTQAQRIVDGDIVQRQRRRPPYLGVGPGRGRIPLFGEIHPKGGAVGRDLEAQARRALDLGRQFAAYGVCEIELAALERDQAGRLVRDHLHHDPLDRGAFAPVWLEGFQGQFQAGVVGHELVGPRANRCLPEAGVAHLLDVFAGDDPVCPGGTRVKEQKIRPNLLQFDDHPPRIGRFQRRDTLPQKGCGRALVSFVGEFDVVGGQRIAIMERESRPQHEGVGQPIRGHRVGFRQAEARTGFAHRLHHGVVHAVHQQIGCDQAIGLAGIEPGRGQGDMNGDVHLALRAGGGIAGPAGNQAGREHRQAQAACDRRAAGRGDGRWWTVIRHSHRWLPCRAL